MHRSVSVPADPRVQLGNATATTSGRTRQTVSIISAPATIWRLVLIYLRDWDVHAASVVERRTGDGRVVRLFPFTEENCLLQGEVSVQTLISAAPPPAVLLQGVYVCVNTHIIVNSFSALIPKTELAEAGILLAPVQLSSRWYLCAQKHPHTFYSVFEKFSQCCL